MLKRVISDCARGNEGKGVLMGDADVMDVNMDWEDVSDGDGWNSGCYRAYAH